MTVRKLFLLCFFFKSYNFFDKVSFPCKYRLTIFRKFLSFTILSKNLNRNSAWQYCCVKKSVNFFNKLFESEMLCKGGYLSLESNFYFTLTFKNLSFFVVDFMDEKDNCFSDLPTFMYFIESYLLTYLCSKFLSDQILF